jgi:hypothetical protein
MKNSNDTVGNRTRDLAAQCRNQMRHRVPRGEQKTPGNTLVYESPQHFGSTVWNLLHVALLEPTLQRCFLIFGTSVKSGCKVFAVQRD